MKYSDNKYLCHLTAASYKPLVKIGTNMIQEQITKLKEVVNQNSMGHLPLSYRVDLMKQIGNTLVVQKILCECCKKVYLLTKK